MNGKSPSRIPERIVRSKLLLVEGMDELNLFSALMKHLSIRGIQVKDLGGKSSLPSKIGAVKQTPGFDHVASLGVVRDADASARNSFRSVMEALRRNQLPCPVQSLASAPGHPSVTVLVVPHNQTSGMLEDVCLLSVQEDPAMTCVDTYFECLRGKSLQTQTNMVAKARSHVFLASRPRANLRLGEAALKGYWNFDSPAFAPLRQLLQLL